VETGLALVMRKTESKRQHHLPQFLQRGFASARRGKFAFTWVYRKGTDPFETNIINVGVEGRFYGDGADFSVDRMITGAEHRFSAAVERARSCSSGHLQSNALPELIAHLEVRSRHLRQVILVGADYFINQLMDYISDPEAFTEFLCREFTRNPAMLGKAISNELSKYGLSSSFLGSPARLGRSMLPLALSQLRPHLPAIAQAMKATLPSKVREAVKSGHISALRQSISPQERVERYAPLSFFAVDMPTGDLILGDSAVVFHVSDPPRYRAFLDAGDTLDYVCLPVSPSRALVGAHVHPKIDRSELKRAIVRCSFEFFIAATLTTENRQLSREIGTDAHPLSRSELEDIVSEVINK